MRALFKKPLVWAIIVFSLSSIFRLSFLNLIEFKSDEATTVYQTVQFFEHPYWASRGLISGTGAYNFPLFNYLMVIIGVWSRDPQVLSGLIAFINSVLVGFFFLLVRRYYNFTIALTASLILAFSPWSVIFSRKIWAQDIINLLFIPFLWLLHELILRKSTKVSLPLFLVLALLVQLHGSGLFILLATLLSLLILKIRISIKNAIIGFLIGMLPAIPYFIFQIGSYPQCPDCDALLKYQHAFRPFDINNLIRPFQTIGGLGYYFVLGKDYEGFIAANPFISLLKYFFVTGFLAILAGIIFILLRKTKYIFLLIYFLLIPFLYLVTRTPAYMHYYVPLIPISCLLFAISIVNTYDLISNKLLKSVVAVYFLFFLVSNIIFIYLFYNFIESKKQIAGDYGPIYSLTKENIEKEINAYKDLPYYDQLKSYAYIYARSKDLHSQLGKFFLEKGNEKLAREEFNK